MSRRPAKTFNFERKYNPDKGCRACKHGEMGVCALARKDIPITCISQNKAPRWCPEVKNGRTN